MSFRYAEFKVKCFRSIFDSFILLIPQHRSACMFTSVLNHNSYETLQVSPPSQQNTDTSLSFWFESFARELENAGKQECHSSALNTNVIRPRGCESFPAGCPQHLSHFTNPPSTPVLEWSLNKENLTRLLPCNGPVSGSPLSAVFLSHFLVPVHLRNMTLSHQNKSPRQRFWESKGVSVRACMGMCACACRDGAGSASLGWAEEHIIWGNNLPVFLISLPLPLSLSCPHENNHPETPSTSQSSSFPTFFLIMP